MQAPAVSIRIPSVVIGEEEFIYYISGELPEMGSNTYCKVGRENGSTFLT